MDTEYRKHGLIMNHPQCKLFATMSCVALTVLVPLVPLTRTAHLKPVAVAFLTPTLCMTIVTLAYGLLCYFRTEHANNVYLEDDAYYYDLPYDSSSRDFVRQEMGRCRDLVRTNEERCLEVLGMGLILSFLVVVGLAIVMLLF